MAWPSTRRENRSSTTAKYNGPWPVSICVTSPHHSTSGGHRGELTAHQIGRGRPLALAGQRPPPLGRTPGQAELGHACGDGVDRHLPARRPQVIGDPRGAVGAAQGGEQAFDLLIQPVAPLPAGGGLAVDPLVEPGLQDPKSPAGDRMRDTEGGPLGRDELHPRSLVHRVLHPQDH
jgi:hypothetical protein